MTITSYREYKDFMSEYRKCALARLHPVMRGHAKDYYKIESTLAREKLPLDQTLAFESALLHNFKANIIDSKIGSCELNLPDPADINYYNWHCLIQMRHLELPTRLIDWSMGDETPLFFGTNSHHGDDGHMWLYTSSMINYENISDPDLKEILQEKYQHINAGERAQEYLHSVDPLNPEKLSLVHFPYKGRMGNKVAEKRRAIQGGKFMVPPNDLISIPIEETFLRPLMTQIKIDGDSKAKILGEMQAVYNINDERVLSPIPADTQEILQEIEQKSREEVGI